MAKAAAVSLEPLAVGIDIGGTGTKFGIVDRNGNVLFSSEMSTRKHKQVEPFIDDLHDRLSEIIAQSGGVGRIRGIGVGAPNGNYYTGTVEYAPNLPWKGIIPLAKLIQDKFQLPTILTNDANAAAIGEMMYGAAKGMKDFVVITLGTGLGCALFDGGRLAPHLELSQAPVRWGLSYDTYIGDKERKRLGPSFWSRRVRRVVDALRPVFVWDRLYLGGGNARVLTPEIVAALGDDVVIVPNTAGIVGGVRAWELGTTRGTR